MRVLNKCRHKLPDTSPFPCTLQAMEEMRKARLMKDMAELRLRNEVNTLESQLGSPRARDAGMCLYLVPDALALCHDLPHIRKLLASEKFFVVIPGTGEGNLRDSVCDET